jgi:AraC-like DNA-binding protein
MFYLGAVGLAIFLNLLLLSKRGKGQADWLLSLWLLIIALHTLTFALMKMSLYPWLLGIDMPLPIVHGPCLFLYTLTLTGHRVKLKDLLMHFALPVAFYLYLAPFIFSPVQEKILVYENEGAGYETFLFIREVCVPLSGVGYVLASIIILRKHRSTIADHFSSVDKVNLAWLQYLIIWLATIWALVIFTNDDWVFGAVVVFIFFIGFFGIRQGVIFSPEAVAAMHFQEKKLREEKTGEKSDEAIAGLEKTKYQKSGLTTDGSTSLHEQLTRVMISEQLFKNSELTLLGLASRINAAPNHVSQVINEREEKSFYDYVNSLRVQEFVKVLDRPESRRLTLFAVAQECGFNSKSSFNRYFKKFTGYSPSEYAESLSTLPK